MRLIYRPQHPQANPNGMVDCALVQADGKYRTYKGADPHFYVIRDEMDATRHMADGHHYTSKAKFRAATKAAGCVELGNDSSLYKPRKPIPLNREKRREDIQRTIYELKNGR